MAKISKSVFVAYIEEIISTEPEQTKDIELLWYATEDDFNVSFCLSKRLLKDLNRQLTEARKNKQ